MNAWYSFVWILFGLFAVFLYTFRSKITLSATDKHPGSILGALLIFIIGGIVGYAIDIWLRFSTVLQYMWVAGGTLMIICSLGIVGLVILFFMFAYVNAKWGQVYA